MDWDNILNRHYWFPEDVSKSGATVCFLCGLEWNYSQSFGLLVQTFMVPRICFLMTPPCAFYVALSQTSGLIAINFGPDINDPPQD